MSSHKSSENKADQTPHPSAAAPKCVDCFNCVLPTAVRPHYLCANPKAPRDLVTGYLLRDCRYERECITGFCGPDGRGFVAKVASSLLNPASGGHCSESLVGDKPGVSVSAIGVELMPLGFAPFGEIVRVNVNADHAHAFCLKTFATGFGCGQPLIVGPMEFVAVLKQSQEPAPVFPLVPDHPGDLNACSHAIPPDEKSIVAQGSAAVGTPRQKASSLADIDRLMNEAFPTGRPARSGAYHQGMRDTLAHRLLNTSFPPLSHPQGSAAFDAYHAGIDEGRAIATRVKTESSGAA